MASDELEAMVDQLAALFHDPSTFDPAADPYAPLRADRAGALALLLDMADDEPDPGRRAARADLLGQVADGFPAFGEACAAPLCRMADAERDPGVLACIGDALGHVADPSAVAPLIGLIPHPDRAVRLAAARAAALLAQPRLYEPLRRWAARREPDDEDQAYWDTIDAALRRCDPAAAVAAEELELALLTTVQASIATSGIEPFDVALAGEYPITEVVMTRGDRQERHPIWNFDVADPDDPTTLDLAFALNRLANIATWL